MTTEKKSVNPITASVIPHVARLFGQRTCRNSAHDPLMYLTRAVIGLVATRATFLAGTFRPAFLATGLSTTVFLVDFLVSSLILLTVFAATFCSPNLKSLLLQTVNS